MNKLIKITASNPKYSDDGDITGIIGQEFTAIEENSEGVLIIGYGMGSTYTIYHGEFEEVTE